jgi:hypothetical protein
MISCPIEPQNIIHSKAVLGNIGTGVSRCSELFNVRIVYILFRLSKKKESKYSKYIIHFSCDNFVFYVFGFNVIIAHICFVFLIPVHALV